MLHVTEIFYSIQGEGFHSGRPAVFCRFSGCNMWSGREQDRAESACPFCDTFFLGKDTYDEDSLVEKLIAMWPGDGQPFVVLTGGEPALQVTSSLISKLKNRHANVAIETNGSVELPVTGPYWVTVSPKKKEQLVVTSGHEMKLLYPHHSIAPEDVAHLDFDYFFLQPIEDLNYKENLRVAIDYCLKNPTWRLSTQNHKAWGVR